MAKKRTKAVEENVNTLIGAAEIEDNPMQDLIDLLTEPGIPFAYDHFAQGESPAPPFITFLLPATNNYSADGKAYLKVDVVHIELYTDEKNPAQENRIESVLDAHEIFYDKTEVWIESEKLYEVLYSFERKAE